MTTNHRLHWLQPDQLGFPDVEQAFEYPNGLLAAGGDLSPERLITAYYSGIFPWFSDDEPILWWSPNPRCVLRPGQLKISRSLKKSINNKNFSLTYNRCFTDVMRACSAPRATTGDELSGTWISDDMLSAYTRLHQLGYAHSVECWLDNKLVGGLYGLAMGQVFFGESMFSRVTDASKVTLVTLYDELMKRDFQLIDGQVYSPHLETLGFELIPRPEFIQILARYCDPRDLLVLDNTTPA